MAVSFLGETFIASSIIVTSTAALHCRHTFVGGILTANGTCEHCGHVFQSKRKVECNLREKAMKRMRAVESDSVKSARKAKDKSVKNSWVSFT